MWDENITITEETFNAFCNDAPNASLVLIYSLSRYHEKFMVTAWTMKELVKRGFSEQDLKDFDLSFSNFYHQMLLQDNL